MRLGEDECDAENLSVPVLTSSLCGVSVPSVSTLTDRCVISITAPPEAMCLKTSVSNSVCLNYPEHQHG